MKIMKCSHCKGQGYKILKLANGKAWRVKCLHCQGNRQLLFIYKEEHEFGQYVN